MDKQNEEQPTDFRSLLEELRKQLLDASTHFDIWEALWPTEKVVDVLNQYRGFFLPTRNAHLSAFFIKICNVMSSGLKSPSFYRILRILSSDGTLAPSINVRLLKKRLNNHKPVLRAIEQYRNERAAHWDTEVSDPQQPVLLGDAKKMLKELQDTFNEIHKAHTGNEIWAFKPVEYSDTSRLLEGLKIRHHKPTGKQS